MKSPQQSAVDQSKGFDRASDRALLTGHRSTALNGKVRAAGVRMSTYEDQTVLSCHAKSCVSFL